MATDTDPYRTLGLERGASLDDVKRAYRRLAKANHPDAAGEAALPRFLAIQAAYDEIAGPDAGSRRAVGRSSAGAPRRAWEADPDRTGATHRAYGSRPRPRPGPRPASGPRSAPRPDRPPRGDRSERPDRPHKKATLGSTSYDDVDIDAFDPDWVGASWYGTTSGTYWTLNPKEYADPRKHGPEYQARARRSGQGRATDDETPPREAATPPEPASAHSIGVDGSGAAAGPPTPTHTTSSWWEATAAEPSTATRPAPAGARSRATGSPPPSSTRRIERSPDESSTALSTDSIIASSRAWLDDDRPTAVARFGRALIGWVPIALGTGWFTGEISGCGRFAATCPPVVAPLSWIVQVGVLVLLFLVPRLARVSTVGAIAILGTVFPASLLLFATGDPEGMAAGRWILGALMIVAWIAGIAYGIAREVRRSSRPLS